VESVDGGGGGEVKTFSAAARASARLRQGHIGLQPDGRLLEHGGRDL